MVAVTKPLTKAGALEMVTRSNLTKRGQYSRGHGVVCKHCGRSFEEHDLGAEVNNLKIRVKRYNYPLSKCRRSGYEPTNMSMWIRLERKEVSREESRWEMEMYLRDARSRSAWGQYSSAVRQDRYDNASPENQAQMKEQAKSEILVIG
jgi:hypothetical protein